MRTAPVLLDRAIHSLGAALSQVQGSRAPKATHSHFLAEYSYQKKHKDSEHQNRDAQLVTRLDPRGEFGDLLNFGIQASAKVAGGTAENLSSSVPVNSQIWRAPSDQDSRGFQQDRLRSRANRE